MKELIGWTLFAVGFFAFMYLLASAPAPKTVVYRDQMIVCDTQDDWGFNNAQTTCYKITKIEEAK